MRGDEPPAERAVLLAHARRVRRGGWRCGRVPVTTRFSQAAGGVWFFAVSISTSSPLRNCVSMRHVAPVDDGADGRVADVGVHGIGEIDRRRPARQRDQATLGREAEDLILEQLELGVLEELFRVVAFEQRFDQAAQPHIGAAVLVELDAGVLASAA